MIVGDLFISQSCGHCHDLYRRLEATDGLQYVRLRRLDEEAAAMRDFKALRGGGTPLLVTPGGTLVYGTGPILLAIENAAMRPGAQTGPDWVLFVGDTCPNCDVVKRMLTQRGLAMPHLANVDREPQALAALQGMGARGIPALASRAADGRVTLVALGPAAIVKALGG